MNRNYEGLKLQYNEVKTHCRKTVKPFQPWYNRVSAKLLNNVPNITKAKHPLIHKFRINQQVHSISTADYTLSQVRYKLGVIQLSKRELYGAAYSLKFSVADISLASYTASPWTHGICEVLFEES